MRSLKIASGNMASLWHRALLSLILRLLRPKFSQIFFFQKRSLVSKSAAVPLSLARTGLEEVQLVAEVSAGGC